MSCCCLSHKTCSENKFWWIGNLSGQTCGWFSKVIFFFNADSISLIKCGLVMSIQLPTYPDPGAFRAGDRHVKKTKYTFNFFLPIPLDEAQLTKEEFGLLENIPVTTEVKDYCLWKIWLWEWSVFICSWS